MSTPRVLALGLLALAFAGCASTPALRAHGPYKPSLEDKPVGYAEAVLRPGYVEISYVGGFRLDRPDARYFATLRAAEVTIQAGKQSFEVLAVRRAAGRRVIYFPPTYETRETGFTAADGTPETEVVEIPAYYEDYYHPMVSLIIHLLDTPSPAGLNAADLLRQGKQKGIVFSPQTEAFLAANAGAPEVATTQPR